MPVPTSLENALETTEPEHIGHGIQPGLLVTRPQCRLHRALRKHGAVFGAVGEFDALHGAGKDHAVIAGDGAAARGSKADVAGSPRAGLAIAPARGMIAERDLTPRRGGLSQHQRSSRGRIDLGTVVHFKNFDVETLI